MTALRRSLVADVRRTRGRLTLTAALTPDERDLAATAVAALDDLLEQLDDDQAPDVLDGQLTIDGGDE